jgi:hypothetical protein
MKVKAELLIVAALLGLTVYAGYRAKQAAGNVFSSITDALDNGANFALSLPGVVADTYMAGAVLDAQNGAVLADGNRAIFGIGDKGGPVAPYGSLGTAVQSWWAGLGSTPATPTTPGNGAPQTDFGGYVSM